MAKLFPLMIAVVFGISFVGLGAAQAKDAFTDSPSIILVSGKAGDDHGKAGEDHGKAGDDHGKKKGHAKKKKAAKKKAAKKKSH